MRTNRPGRHIGIILCWIVGLVLFAGTLPAASQEVESQLTIERVTQEMVNGRPVVMVTITNHGSGRMGYTGRVEIIHPGGTLADALNLAPGSVAGDTSLRIPVYLSEGLLQGDYTMQVTVMTGAGEPLAVSGPHSIRIGDLPSSGPPFPAIILLIAGLLLILASFRVGHTRRKKRQVPDVATIRKVAVHTEPARERAKITPLIPPRFRQDE